MLNKIKYEGKTLEEAIEKCLEELDLYQNDIFYTTNESEDKVEIEVITKEEILKYIREYIQEFGKQFGTDIKSEVNFDEDTIKVMLISKDNAILIGKDGRTLNAIQMILRQVVNKVTGETIRVNVDVSNYKAKKERYLERNIRELARQVSKTGVDTKLDPMNSYDRRVVHNIVSQFDNLTSESFGEEPNRYVVISRRD